MRLRSLSTGLSLVAACVIVASCSRDNPTSPQLTDPPRESARLGLLGSPTTIVPLQRTSALATNQTHSATIGLLGGSIAIPSAGFSLVVPPLAVLSPVTISVTALAGSNVAYTFEPHGLHFLLPVIATQNLSATDARFGGPVNPLSLIVGYFPSVTNLTSVTELLNLQLNLPLQTSTALLTHFSGYVWSSGRASESEEGTEER